MKNTHIRLGLCSSYSFLYGVRSPGELAAKARMTGVGVISICDRNSLYGVHRFLEAAKEEGLKPIIGVSLFKENEGGGESGKVYCFAKNKEGFKRLCQILSERKRDKKAYEPVKLLIENPRGLIIASSSGEALEKLSGKVEKLYAALTPSSTKAIGPGHRLGIPLAFIDDSVFLEKDDYKTHRVLRAIKLNKTIGNLKEYEALKEGPAVLSTGEEIWKRLKSWPECFKGAWEIANECGYDNLFNGFIFPEYNGNKTEEEEELRRRVYQGASLRYGELGDGEIERIEYELTIIGKKGFASYFLTMDDIVKLSPRTCGRGSGAASIVSYSLGITNVDPVAHKLYFERFLNPARLDPPDIDVDFAWDERDSLIKSVISKFGEKRCARVANHNFFRPRSALRETAKAYGYPDAEISKIERKIFDYGEKRERNIGQWGEVFSIAKKIEGLPRGLGMHCGGLVITPGEITDYAPVEKSKEGFPLLAWEKEGVEEAGFVKIDLLGNRSLAVIRDALMNLEEEGIFIDKNSWRPFEDAPTIEALSKGDSIGVFYIESPAMRQLQKKTGAGDFEHIVIHSSIIRPAANAFINEYVRRLKGGAWEPLHPRLGYILDETYGILCYQEDVSKTAVALAGFSEDEADKLRKAIAKKASGIKLADYEKRFFEGCFNNGVDEGTAGQVWQMMMSFDGYSFCKPHSASYAMVSFQSAYLRVHNPAEFMAAVLSNQGGYYRPSAYISECRRMGLILKGPCVNLSKYRYYGKGNEVVIGFLAIKGVSLKGCEKIIREREERGDYKSLEDFSKRVRLDRGDIISLCPSGVFDSVSNGIPRPLQARYLLESRPQLGGKKDSGGDDDLFSFSQDKAIKAGKDFTIMAGKSGIRWEELDGEYNALGFLRDAHPLLLWKDEIIKIDRVKSLDMGRYIGRNINLIGWPITQKEVWTKEGLSMSFLSFEDEVGMYESVIFPCVYEKYYTLLFDQRPLEVYGKVSCDNGALSLEVSNINVIKGR